MTTSKQHLTVARAAISLVLALLLFACGGSSEATGKAQGQGSYQLGPDLPTIFTFDRDSMSCSASWGTLGAPGPGPFTDIHMNAENANFGMIVYSLNVKSFTVTKNEVTMTGQARSITTINDKIVENAVYDFTVHAMDGGSPTADKFSMTLNGPGLMFDKHTFEPSPDAKPGLTNGDIVIQP
jgi:hypothetical protein